MLKKISSVSIIAMSLLLAGTAFASSTNTSSGNSSAFRNCMKAVMEANRPPRGPNHSHTRPTSPMQMMQKIRACKTQS